MGTSADSLLYGGHVLQRPRPSGGYWSDLGGLREIVGMGQSFEFYALSGDGKPFESALTALSKFVDREEVAVLAGEEGLIQAARIFRRTDLHFAGKPNSVHIDFKRTPLLVMETSAYREDPETAQEWARRAPRLISCPPPGGTSIDLPVKATVVLGTGGMGKTTWL